MGKRFDDAALSVGYLRALASRRKLRSKRVADEERDALRQLYGADRPVSPENRKAAGGAHEEVFHDGE